jgi:hypothetical protein
MLPAADAALPDFLPPDTKVMIGVRLRAIVSSQMFQSVASQAVAAGSDWMTVASMIGFDPLKDIDEIFIASPADRQNAPALAIVRGRFDVERLSKGAKRYHGIPLLAGGKGPDSLIALLDASTAIAGDAESVHGAIDRRGKTAISPAMAARVEILRGKYDIWGAGEVPKGVVPPAGAQAPGLESVDRFEFGLQLTHGIDASAELHARSAKDLEKLAGSLQFFKSAMASQQGQAASAVKLETHVEGNTLKISLKVPEEEMRKAMLARAAAPSRPVVARTPTPAVPAAAPAQVKDGNGDTVLLTLPGKR